MYKDKDKQREANKQAAKRRRDKVKGMTPDSHTVIPEAQNVTPCVIPAEAVVIPSPAEQQSHSPMKVGYVPPGGASKASDSPQAGRTQV